MPKQSENEKAREVAFKTWWDHKYFSTDGRHKSVYRVYKELHQAGADLDDIDRLCRCFLYGESVSHQLKDVRFHRKRTRLRTARTASLHLDEVLTAVENYEKAWDSAYVALEDLETVLRDSAQRSQSVFLPALLEFHLRSASQLCFANVGRKPDLWGSFFLLVVTEYMKQESGREHYREADELLRSWRGPKPVKASGKPLRTGNKKRWTAAKRIEQLKRAYPDWQDVITPVLLQLQLDRNGVTQYRANISPFLKRWSATKPLTNMFVDHLKRLGLPPPPTETSLSLGPPRPKR